MIFRIREDLDEAGVSTFMVEGCKSKCSNWVEMLKPSEAKPTLEGARNYIKYMKFRPIYHDEEDF